jgi:hypothetical protein
MAEGQSSLSLIAHEARSLLTRLARVKPFALLEPMLPAAAISPPAQTAIERYLADSRIELRSGIQRFIAWIESTEGQQTTPALAQRRFTLLRLQFNSVLSQFDTFADVITQRSEHETGVWLSGLDVVAADALTLPGNYYDAPPLICYLERGPGAAIRRARTRMPGGTENPVAIIQMPRERMVGSGIASSLVHEVGHQAAALLDLVETLRPRLQERQAHGDLATLPWRHWERWISEIVADFWSVARIGIGSTYGLMSVVSLPQAFVFRVNDDDPHPIPWIRVKLSCAIGKALYPHQQWEVLANLWESFYPLDELDDERLTLFRTLENNMPEFVNLLTHHRPPKLRGQSLLEVMHVAERQPPRLTAYYDAWRETPEQMRLAPPCLVFAVLGQARADGTLSAVGESKMLAYLLTFWALRSTLDTSALSARQLHAWAARSTLSAMN